MGDSNPASSNPRLPTGQASTRWPWYVAMVLVVGAVEPVVGAVRRAAEPQAGRWPAYALGVLAAADLRAVYRFRYAVYVEEMGRPQKHADHAAKLIADPLDVPAACLLAAWDAGEVVGTVRTNYLRYCDIGEYADQYALAGLSPDQFAATSITTRLMVHPRHRRTTLATRLACETYRRALEYGISADFIDCNAHLVIYFAGLGYRSHRPELIHPEYGAVTVMRLTDAASKAVDQSKELADKVLSTAHAPRRHVPDYLGLFRAGCTELAAALRNLKSVHFEEAELVGGFERMAGLIDESAASLGPAVEKYGEAGSSEPAALRAVLFPSPRPGPFDVLRDLHALTVQAADVQGSVVTLVQVAQGLRDPDVLGACRLADEHVKRVAAWAQNHLKHRAVHTLVVPA